jgi:hypothetical protein
LGNLGIEITEHTDGASPALQVVGLEAIKEIFEAMAKPNPRNGHNGKDDIGKTE